MEHGVVAGVDDGGDARRASTTSSSAAQEPRRADAPADDGDVGWRRSVIGPPARTGGTGWTSAVGGRAATRTGRGWRGRRRSARPRRCVVVEQAWRGAPARASASPSGTSAAPSPATSGIEPASVATTGSADLLGLEDREAEALVERRVGEHPGVAEQPRLRGVVDGSRPHDRRAGRPGPSASTAASTASASSPPPPAMTSRASRWSAASGTERGDERRQVLAPFERAERERRTAGRRARGPRVRWPRRRGTGSASGPRWMTSTRSAPSSSRTPRRRWRGWTRGRRALPATRRRSTSPARRTPARPARDGSGTSSRRRTRRRARVGGTT